MIFPSGYSVNIIEIVPIVGTFSTSLDYVIERETERIKTNEFFKKTVFNDQIKISLNVTEPLYQHFYGIAWNAPQKKKKQKMCAMSNKLKLCWKIKVHT